MTPSASKQGTTVTSAITSPADLDPSQGPSEWEGPSERHAEIAEAAFYIAQARGFEPGNELDDWLAAEFEVNRRRPGIDR